MEKNRYQYLYDFYGFEMDPDKFFQQQFENAIDEKEKELCEKELQFMKTDVCERMRQYYNKEIELSDDEYYKLGREYWVLRKNMGLCYPTL